MKRTLAASGVLSLALFMTACAEDDSTTEDTTTEETTATATTEATETETTEAETTEATATEETDAAAAEGEDIVDTAVGAGSFTTLVTAVQAAGLEETLRGEGPFTVFAPTDEAFETLPEGTLDELLADPEGDLSEILQYHVVAGEVFAADVLEMDGETVETVQGGTFTIEVDGEQVVLLDTAGNRINVVDTDVEASNGVIHVLDGVLSPTP
jgi:uncharacterized surface protein with fasciclin (FAS1) repeats